MLEVLQLYVKRIVAISALLLIFAVSKGQDPVFTQYYLNKNYLNPAFAGSKGKPSFALNSRLQYTAVPGILATNTFSANFGGNKETKGLGFAFMYADHVEGEGFLHTSNLSGQISKSLRLNKGNTKRPLLLTAGLQFGLGQKRMNWDKLQFSDQFDPYESGVQNATFLNSNNDASNVYFDAGFGLKAFIPYGGKRRKSYFTVGASAFHINKPTQSLFGAESKLMPRYSFFGFTHIGKEVQYDKDRKYISIGFLLDFQQGLRTNTISFFKELNKEITLGLSFRRQEFLVIDQNFDALAAHFLYSKGKFQMGYSYDFTVSTLGEEKTFGSHEIGITYFFDRNRIVKKKPVWKKGDPCPQPGSVM